MAIEIVDFPMNNDDFPWQNVSSPEGTSRGTATKTRQLIYVSFFHAYSIAAAPKSKWWVRNYDTTTHDGSMVLVYIYIC